MLGMMIMMMRRIIMNMIIHRSNATNAQIKVMIINNIDNNNNKAIISKD